MSMLLCFPSPIAKDLEDALILLGINYKDTNDFTNEIIEAYSWTAVIVHATNEIDQSLSFCDKVRKSETGYPIFFIISQKLIRELFYHKNLFDDFCVDSASIEELRMRLDKLTQPDRALNSSTKIVYDKLLIDTETYQVTVDKKPIDLTFMEYQLLKYLASKPGKVVSRQVLLSNVWGYDYFGGTRTVDVHIRRLRSKLGEEYSQYIHTVRSVGYKFAKAR
jgi:two-component system alkaline phosphatase synthesis response regulator PhoP